MQQKKKVKFPLPMKIVLTVVAVVVLFAGGIFAKMQYEQSIMNPLNTGEVVPGVYVVNNGFVNFYLVASGDEYLMIDAGNDIKQTEAALEDLHISADAVSTILLTHSDNDHIATLSLFRDAQIYLPSLEAQMIDGTTRRSLMGHNHLEQDYTALNDGERINLLGLNIECISTPGHTPGSMSYLLDGRYLFVGDTMSLQDGKAETFNSFYNMDSDSQRKSIGKLAANTQPEYIFTGHYGYTDDVRSAFDGWH